MSDSFQFHRLCSLPGSSVHGISQARILEWVDISFSRGSSWPRDRTRVSYISCINRQILYHWATWSVQNEFLLSSEALGQAVFNLSFSSTLIYLESPKGKSKLHHASRFPKKTGIPGCSGGSQYPSLISSFSYFLLSAPSKAQMKVTRLDYNSERSPLHWKKRNQEK